MGVWGPGIFSDDDACDVREEVRDLVADGVAPAQIERRILDEYASPLSDRYHQAVARLALALTLHKYGRLEPGLREAAVGAIDDGSAIGEWRDDRQRRAALQKGRAQLLSPQPLAKKLRKRTIYEWPWPASEIVACELPSGTQFVFVVRDVRRDQGGSFATIVPIRASKDIPDSAVLLSAPVLSVRPEWVATFNKKIRPTDPYWPMFSEICLLALPNKTPQRFRPLGLQRPMEQRMASGNAVLYRDFDSYLERVFGLS